MLDNPLIAIRGLKGAALAVLLVLVINKGKAMRAYEIQTWTAYANQAITGALRVLTTIGLVQKGPKGYSLIDQFDFWVSIAGNSLAEKNHENHDNSDLLLLNPSVKESLLINNNNRRKNHENHDFIEGEQENHENHDIPEGGCGKPVDNFGKPVDNFLTDALESYGIVEPMRSQLAQIAGLTEEALHGLAKDLKRQAGERYTTGLLVHALRAGSWKVSRRPGGGEGEDRSRYISGEFASFVEH